MSALYIYHFSFYLGVFKSMILFIVYKYNVKKAVLHRWCSHCRLISKISIKIMVLLIHMILNV